MEPLWLLLLGAKAGLRIGHFLEKCSVKGNTQTELPLGTNEKAFVVPNSQAEGIPSTTQQSVQNEKMQLSRATEGCVLYSHQSALLRAQFKVLSGDFTLFWCFPGSSCASLQ